MTEERPDYDADLGPVKDWDDLFERMGRMEARLLDPEPIGTLRRTTAALVTDEDDRGIGPQLCQDLRDGFNLDDVSETTDEDGRLVVRIVTSKRV